MILISSLLQQLSHLEMEAHFWRQHQLSANLERLAATTDNIASTYEDHAQAVIEVKNMTNEVLETLENVSGATAKIKEADRLRWGSSGLGSWMPYILSPAATLFLGSYGLAPSALRNLGLVALGEVIGLWVTHFDRITRSWTILGLFDNAVVNATVTTL